MRYPEFLKDRGTIGFVAAFDGLYNRAVQECI